MFFRDGRTLFLERAALAAYLIGCASIALHPLSSPGPRDCLDCGEKPGGPSLSVLCHEAGCLDPEHRHHRHGPSRTHDHDAASCGTCQAAASSADVPPAILVDLEGRAAGGLPGTTSVSPAARTTLPRSRSPPLA